MKPTENCIHAEHKEAESHITDIVLFFSKTTNAYEQFEQRILEVSRTLPALSPQQILDECQKLRDQRTELEILDQQMFDIIELAGSKISKETMIDDFRIALAKANMASTKLRQRLLARKIILEEELSEFVDQENIF